MPRIKGQTPSRESKRVARLLNAVRIMLLALFIVCAAAESTQQLYDGSIGYIIPQSISGKQHQVSPLYSQLVDISLFRAITQKSL